jgi:hypothetical protein
MLTKDEILRKMNGFECPEYIVTPCWQPIYDQCVAAIDLAAENERLKAKLDAVRKWASNPVRIDDFGYRMAQESVLAILDGDGDDT